MPERSLSPRSVYYARPTVRVDGREDAMLQELLTAMEMREQEGGLSALELRFSNVMSTPAGDARLAFEDDSVLGLGRRLEVWAGEAAAPRMIFDGVITGVEAEFSREAPPELVALAEDRLQQARMARRSAVYTDQQVGDIARTIAARHGLTPRIDALNDEAGVHVQWNESDLAFLRRLLERHDGDVQVVGNELHVAARGAVRRSAIDLVIFGQLRSARILADLAHQVTRVTTAGWDAGRGRVVRGESAGAAAGPGTGRTGAQVLETALAQRAEHIAGAPVVSDGEARALADAMFDARARRFVVLEGTAEGNPELRVGTHVNIRGVGARFENTYYVVKAVHRFDLDRGYETDFEAECAFLGAA